MWRTPSNKWHHCVSLEERGEKKAKKSIVCVVRINRWSLSMAYISSRLFDWINAIISHHCHHRPYSSSSRAWYHFKSPKCCQPSRADKNEMITGDNNRSRQAGREAGNQWNVGANLGQLRERISSVRLQPPLRLTSWDDLTINIEPLSLSSSLRFGPIIAGCQCGGQG